MRAVSEPATILVGMLLPIGDTLLATPVLAALRRRFPQAEITVLVSRSNAGILQDNPNFDHLVLSVEKGSEPSTVRLLRSVGRLRRQRFDMVVTLSPASFWVLLLANVYRRGTVALKLDLPPLWWLLGTRSPEFRQRHAADHYTRAIAPVLHRPLTEEERQPKIYLTADDRRRAREHLRTRDLSPARMIAMHVGGKGFNGRKRWAPDRFAQVARELVERFDAHVVLIGGNEDVERSEEVAAMVPRNITVLAGKTSLKESSALIEMATLFVGNDSCPLHIAAFVGTPAVGIFGPSNYKQFTPISARRYRQRIIHSTVACSPCIHFIGNNSPVVPNTCYTYACLNAISVEQVTQAAVELLRERAPVR